ncbi:MAG: MarR family transcriptional regulator [Ardenticatenales bacterium]|nr:MarR family transcriptional regulator [Ardenticatenales bacterium]
MEPYVCEGVLGAWRAFLTAHARLIEAVDHRLAEAGCVCLGTCDVLLALRDAPDHRRRMHELADHVVLSRSGLTRLVDRLEAEGLLRRERCPNDRRGAYAALTEAGERALLAAWPVYAASVADLFGSALTEHDAARLTTALDRATANAVNARHA